MAVRSGRKLRYSDGQQINVFNLVALRAKR
jgi:hypothetical protein